MQQQLELVVAAADALVLLQVHPVAAVLLPMVPHAVVRDDVMPRCIVHHVPTINLQLHKHTGTSMGWP